MILIIERTISYLSYVFFNLGSAYSYEPIVSKENTGSAFGLEIMPVKPKKTVKINDSAATKDFHRISADSPDLIKTSKTIVVNEVFLLLLL